MSKQGKICIAVGDKSVENWLKEKLGKYFDFGSDCSYKDKVAATINIEEPDILILSDQLSSGQQDEYTTQKILKEIARKCRVILIAGNRHKGDRLLERAITFGCCDIITGETVQLAEVIKMVFNPTDPEDAYNKYCIDDDEEDEEKTPDSPVKMVDQRDRKTGKSIMNIPGFAENTDDLQAGGSQTTSEEKPRAEKGGVWTEAGTKTATTVNPQTAKPQAEVKKTTPQTSTGQKPKTVNPTIRGKQVVADSGDTTILTSGNIKPGIIFRPAREEDFDTVFDNGNKLPGPDSPEGAYTKKNVLYSTNEEIAMFKNRMQNINNAKLSVFAGARQGVGVTTTVLNTAFSLAYKGKKVLVLDADMGGKSCIFEKLGLGFNWHSFDSLCTFYLNGYDIRNQFASPEFLLNSGNPQADKFSVFPKTIYFTHFSPDLRPEMQVRGLTECIKFCMTQFDYILVDLNLTKYGETVSTFLNLADSIVCVTTQDAYEVNKLTETIISYRQTVNFMGKVRIAVNRFKKGSLDLNFLREETGASVIIGIDEDTVTHLRADNSWVPYYITTRKKKYLKNYDMLAEAL